jgi:hypothetical protein
MERAQVVGVDGIDEGGVEEVGAIGQAGGDGEDASF